MNQVLESCKKWYSADVKADVIVKQQEIKELVAISCKFLQEVPSKIGL